MQELELGLLWVGTQWSGVLVDIQEDIQVQGDIRQLGKVEDKAEDKASDKAEGKALGIVVGNHHPKLKHSPKHRHRLKL